MTIFNIMKCLYCLKLANTKEQRKRPEQNKHRAKSPLKHCANHHQPKQLQSPPLTSSHKTRRHSIVFKARLTTDILQTPLLYRENHLGTRPDVVKKRRHRGNAINVTEFFNFQRSQ